MKKVVVMLTIALLAGAGSAQAQELIQGGSFEYWPEVFELHNHLNVGDWIKSIRNFRDAFCLQHAQNLVQILVDVAAFVQRCAPRVADDALNFNATERTLDVTHSGVDIVVNLGQLTLCLTARHDSS